MAAKCFSCQHAEWRMGYTACNQHSTSRKPFPHPTPGPVPKKKKGSLRLIMGYWTCMVCNIEMQWQSRDQHLSGKRHAAAAEKYQERIPRVTRTREAGKQWNCTICNTKMNLQSRDSHLSGKRHAMNVQSQEDLSESNNTASSSSATTQILPATSGVSGITEDTIFTILDMTVVHGALAAMVWQCTTCGCYVPQSLWQLHLSSIDHVQKLLESIRVTCMAISQPQLRMTDNSLGEEENLDYQDAVLGVGALTAYLPNQPPYREAIAGFSAINSSPGLATQINRRSKRGTSVPTCPDCKAVLIGGNDTMHSCLYPQLTPVPPASPLDSFFLSFSGYKYDPSVSPAESFRSFKRGLKRWNDWDGYSPSTWEDYEEDIDTRYQAALTKEFNLWFGTEDDIGSWHSLCRAVAIHPLPATCKLCRKAVRGRHVNIVDLIQWARGREVKEVKIFKTVKELSVYSYKKKRLYDKNQAGQGAVLRHLLRHLSVAYLARGNNHTK